MALNSTSEYAFVAAMFRHLQTLDQESRAFARQRDEIIERCLPLADHIARRFRDRGEPLDDLVQAARVGLVNAVNRFDVDNGTDFLGFAVPTITGEVRRHFRDHGWAVKVPRRLKDLRMQLNQARAELSHQLNRAPTATELANHLGIDRESVVEATIACSNYTTLSTDVATDDDQHQSLGDRMGDVDPALDKVLDVESVRPLITALPDREQAVISLRFFDNMTQTQIAERIGCSQMHVSRLLAKALGTLRTNMMPEVSGKKPELVTA